jgi:PKD repeat protein
VISGGFDIALSDQWGLLLEARGAMPFDDEKVDGVAHDGSDPDFMVAFTAGLRFNFSKPFHAVVIGSATGPSTALTGEDATFEATTNSDATQPVTYTWDFGDGSRGSGLVATHQYEREGTYTVTFTAANKRSTDSRSMTIMVERPVVAPSVVTVTFTPTDADTQTPVTFNANIRGDQPMSYRWDFGDGSTGTGASPQHTFSSPGTYTVRLTATNEGGSDTRTVTVTVVPYEAEICRELTDLNPAFFDRNSSTLTAEARAALQDNVDILNECPNICVKIDGLAAPGERSAQDLSAARARAVEKFYTDNGIAPSRLVAEGKGRAPGVSRKEGLSQYRRADSIPGACGM